MSMRPSRAHVQLLLDVERGMVEFSPPLHKGGAGSWYRFGGRNPSPAQGEALIRLGWVELHDKPGCYTTSDVLEDRPSERIYRQRASLTEAGRAASKGGE